MWLRVVPLTFVSLGLCLLAQDQQHSQTTFYNQKKEAALGASLASQIRRQTTALGLVRVDEYVQNLGLRLATQMPDPAENWTLTVVQNREAGPTQEPLWLPGGYLFIPAKLMIAAENEAEFAGMLAHAMAHVAKRHALRQATSGETAQLATIPLIFVTGWTTGDSSLTPLTGLTLRRQLELEADQVAVQAMASAGFDPHSLLHYVARVSAQTSATEEHSPFPPAAVRLNALQQVVQNLPTSNWAAGSESFHSLQGEVRQQIERLIPPQDVRRIPSLRHPNQNQ
jgi:predicted Zn-dependent protease